VADAHRGERWDYGDFSTAHSNGTNKVIDTPYILCYSAPRIPKLILAEVMPLDPERLYGMPHLHPE